MSVGADPRARGVRADGRLRRSDRRPLFRSGWLPSGLLDPPDDPYPSSLTIGLEKVETLRYGENPHQPAARYRRPGSTLADGPFGVGTRTAPGQGALLQQRPRRGGGIGPRARPARPRRRHRQAHQPVRRRRTDDAHRRLGCGARGGPGQRLRRGRRADPARGRRGRREARLDLPRDRRRARLRPRRPRDPGDQAEPAGRRSTRRSPTTSHPPPRPTRPARSGPRAARSSSRHPTSPPTTRLRGPARPAARRRRPSSSTSISPGGSSAA